jgi:hypothetical protein
MTGHPKDFIHWTCKKCPDEIDDPDESELAGYPEGCTSNATRDHAPTLCPCRGEPAWKVGYIIVKGDYFS